MNRTRKSKPFRSTLKFIFSLFPLFLLLTGCASADTKKEETATSSTQPNTGEELPEKEQLLKNEYAFSKLLGYIYFYHPSDEASELNWNSFTVSGAEKVQYAKDTQELTRLLEELYFPVAPTLLFFNPQKEEAPNVKADYETAVVWQHKGLGLADLNNPSIFESERVQTTLQNGKTVLEEKKIFDEYPAIGESVIVDLTDELSAVVPLTVEVIDGKTIPLNGDQERFKQLKSDISSPSEKVENPAVRYAGMALLWNHYQHFYPYFDLLNVRWEDELRPALEAAYESETKDDYYTAVMNLLAKTEDGHANYSEMRFPEVTSASSPKLLPFQATLLNEKVILTTVGEDSGLKQGDHLIAINGKEVVEWLKEIQQTIPGSSQYKEYTALQYLRELEGKNLVIQRDGQEQTVEAVEKSTEHLDEFHRTEPFFEVEEGIWSIDLTQPIGNELENKWESLKSAKGLIFDMRGYPASAEEVVEVLSRLTDKPIEGPKDTFHGSIYPDRKAPILIDVSTTIEPKGSGMDIPVTFLTYEGSMSMPEYFLKFVKEEGLGTIVGRNTAGSDGNVYVYNLPGRMLAGITLLDIELKDGTQTQFIGLEPDVRVIQTEQGIKEGRDEFMETAIQVIKRNKK